MFTFILIRVSHVSKVRTKGGSEIVGGWSQRKEDGPVSSPVLVGRFSLGTGVTSVSSMGSGENIIDCAMKDEKGVFRWKGSISVQLAFYICFGAGHNPSRCVTIS